MQWFSKMTSHQELWLIKYLILEYIKSREFEKKAVEFWKLVGAVELRFGRQTRCIERVCVCVCVCVVVASKIRWLTFTIALYSSCREDYEEKMLLFWKKNF